MRRFLSRHAPTWAFAVPLAIATAAAGLLAVAACSTSTSDATPAAEDASSRKDGDPVAPAEAGAYDAGTAPGPEPSCAKYCDLVMESCDGAEAQYASRTECLEICARLPAGDAGDIEQNTVACRQYYAGSPARANAGGYCLAAGPFGGGVCGDRCIAFCGLALGACSPDAGPAPYGSYPDCQTACAGYPYTGATEDGGGEPPNGPEDGNTLNCRLYHLRGAIHDGTSCADLGADSGACR